MSNAYTRTDMIGMFRVLAGFNDNLEQSIILQLFNFAQQYYERSSSGRLPQPWFRFHTGEATLLANQSQVSVPEDFLAFDDEWPAYISMDVGKKELGIVRPSSMPANIAAGEPTCAAFDGVKLWFNAQPTVNRTITFHYFRRMEKLSVSLESDWYEHFPLLIVTRALVAYFNSTKNTDSLRTTNLQELEDDYLVRCVSMRESLVTRIKGGAM